MAKAATKRGESDSKALILPHDRYFDPDPAQKRVAMEIYEEVANLPLICPHGHVDPRVFADPDYQFGTPTDLLIIPDHYVFRMLYSQGIPLEQLGILERPGFATENAKGKAAESSTEQDHRRIWQLFADNYYLFRGTPTGMWLNHELYDVFGVREQLNSGSALRIYDRIEDN